MHPNAPRPKPTSQQEPTAEELFDPADFTTPKASHAVLKNWATTGRAAALRVQKSTKSTSENEAVGRVARQFYIVFEQADRAQETPTAIVDDFVVWKGDKGYGDWPLFETAQNRIVAEARKRKANLDLAKQVAKIAENARAMAISRRNRFPNGPNGVVGTVCAGLADSTGTWGGTSGHNDVLHDVMKTLLSPVQQVEKWPVGTCGEVQAMNQYLKDRNIKSVNDIPRGSLYSHAETWKWPTAKEQEKGINGTWGSRGACLNCEQWLNKIGANFC